MLLSEALDAGSARVGIVSPFIKTRAAKRLLAHGEPTRFRVITRFNLADFANRVSDLSALRLLLDHGAEIRGVKGLHAKLYLVGELGIITSANLTEAGLLNNHELGVVVTGRDPIAECRRYFRELWSRAGHNLTASRVDEWEEIVDRYLAEGAGAAATGLPDEGADAGTTAGPVTLPPAVDEIDQSFVKFFGKSTDRASRHMSTLDEVRRSGSHWACSYPTGARPRQVRDGALMFMGRMVHSPNDTLIYGRAVGMAYEEGRDDASPADLRRRPWKSDWSRYVRVHHAEFVAGSLSNGVSLNELMDVLQANAFAPTQRNARFGYGNTNPRRAYLRRPSVELAPAGYTWLTARLQRAFDEHGKLEPHSLERLDWPTL